MEGTLPPEGCLHQRKATWVQWQDTAPHLGDYYWCKSCEIKNYPLQTEEICAFLAHQVSNSEYYHFPLLGASTCACIAGVTSLQCQSNTLLGYKDFCYCNWHKPILLLGDLMPSFQLLVSTLHPVLDSSAPTPATDTHRMAWKELEVEQWSLHAS